MNLLTHWALKGSHFSETLFFRARERKESWFSSHWPLAREKRMTTRKKPFSHHFLLADLDSFRVLASCLETRKPFDRIGEGAKRTFLSREMYSACSVQFTIATIWQTPNHQMLGSGKVYREYYYRMEYIFQEFKVKPLQNKIWVLSIFLTYERQFRETLLWSFFIKFYLRR